jgi:D-arabinose 5-phosphate isomerase GutQ
MPIILHLHTLWFILHHIDILILVSLSGETMHRYKVSSQDVWKTDSIEIMESPSTI